MRVSCKVKCLENALFRKSTRVVWSCWRVLLLVRSLVMLTGIVILLFTLHQTSASRTQQYECGAHGRFEYCIDGFPGCVIGCHCYPGYYFDTDTKICEPNGKLIQQYRRMKAPEPFPVEPTLPPPRSPVTAQNIPIKKNSTEDLSDWLYEQFFKTVENQVINKTDNHAPSRRSGSRHVKRKKVNRSTARRKKDKSLRKKLLRITEDDSLFQSSSSGSDDDDDDSDSASSDSNYSKEYERSRESKDNHAHHPDGPHDYKEFVIINKKPKPPLPSFIFMPHMDTPFYPPLALPPPPVPMYPMVPVPPMIPMFPFQAGKDCTTESTGPSTAGIMSTNLSSTEANKDAVPTTANTVNDVITTKAADIPTTAQTEVTPATTEATTEATTAATIAAGSNVLRANDDPGKLRAQKRLRKSRNKLLKQFRERQKMMRQQEESAYIPIQTNIQGNDHPDFSSMYNEILKSSNNNAEKAFNDFEGPVIESPANLLPEETTNKINFKYLSQLIHRNDPNAPINLPVQSPYGAPPSEPNFNVQPPNAQLPPSINAPQPPTRRLTSPDVSRNDKYFTNLGREIAALIRRIDKKGELEINVEIDSIGNQDAPAQPLFNDNTYGARSYWERSVRSPYQAKMNQYRPISRPKKHNSRETLFDLENKVFVAASTEPSLNLIELEDIINFIEFAKVLKAEKPLKQTNRSLNISLMPKVKQLATVKPKPKIQLKKKPPIQQKQLPPAVTKQQRPRPAARPPIQQHVYSNAVQLQRAKPQTHYSNLVNTRRNSLGLLDYFIGLQMTNSSKPPSPNWRSVQKLPANNFQIPKVAMKLPPKNTTGKDNVLTKPSLPYQNSYHHIGDKPQRHLQVQPHPYIPSPHITSSTVIPQRSPLNPLVFRGAPQQSPSTLSRRFPSVANVGFGAGPYPYPSFFHRGDTHHFDYFE